MSRREGFGVLGLGVCFWQKFIPEIFCNVLPTNSFFGLIFLEFDAHNLTLSFGLKFRCVPRCCLVGGKEGLLVGGGEDGGVCVWGRSSGVSN